MQRSGVFALGSERCDRHIIANGTCSWWAAWLADAEAARVIAPIPLVICRTDGSRALPSQYGLG